MTRGDDDDGKKDDGKNRTDSRLCRRRGGRGTVHHEAERQSSHRGGHCAGPDDGTYIYIAKLIFISVFISTSITFPAPASASSSPGVRPHRPVFPGPDPLVLVLRPSSLPLFSHILCHSIAFSSHRTSSTPLYLLPSSGVPLSSQIPPRLLQPLPTMAVSSVPGPSRPS